MPTLPPGVEAVQVPLSLFGGLNTELAPTDVPEGVSPDCQDVGFLPGGVFTRPALRRLFTAPVSGDVSMVYQTTFLQPSGMPINLYFDSAGHLWQEDPIGAPGVLSLVYSGTAQLYYKAVCAFGREYLAGSDGLHGAAPPMQWDGVNLDRVTQDGPGAAPTAADEFLTVTIDTIALINPASGAVTVATASFSGNVAKIGTAAAHGLQPGVQVYVTVGGTGTNGFWGVQTVQSVPTPTSFTYTVGTPSAVFAVTGGTVHLAFALVTLVAPAALDVGDNIVIQGNTGTLNNGVVGAGVPNTPANYQVAYVIDSRHFYFSFNEVTLDTTGLFTGILPGAGGTLTGGGLSSPGQYNIVVGFITRNGALTAPSPVGTYISAGNAKLAVSNLPIGPPNVVGRYIGLTPANGSSWFTILADVTIPDPIASQLALSGLGVAQPVTVKALVVPDNISTSWTFDVADNVLMDATGIDIPGNNLFAQVVLGPCLGFFSYAQRLVGWGEYNKLQNLVNMGLDGGYLAPTPGAPLGWTLFGAGGQLVTTASYLGSGFGLAWEMTGAGTSTPGAGLEQGAYQDEDGIAILAPDTAYLARIWLAATDAVSGQVVFQLFSPTAGTIATATINLVGLTPQGGFYEANFNAPTGATIPADTVLQCYQTNMGNGETLIARELEVCPQQNPYFLESRWSYADNPEGFDGVTGVLGPQDGSGISCFGAINDTGYVFTPLGWYRFDDAAAQEPSLWEVRQVSNVVGTLGAWAVDAGKFGKGDSGEQYLSIATSAGLYIYNGSEMGKVSQEIYNNLWAALNPAASFSAWVKNDTANRRIYVGLPLEDSTAPSQVLVLDYRNLETAYAIENSPPIRISFTGKMIASDITRKWTRWNIFANYGEILSSAQGDRLALAGGNGLAPGDEPCFGQAYYLDATKYTDDDYGPILSYYTTYFLVNHEAEQALGLGSHRKQAEYLSALVGGVGSVGFTPFVNSLSNPWAATVQYALSADPTFDLEWPLWVKGERMAFRVQPQAAAGQTDAAFRLQKLVVNMRPDPTAPIRGAVR